MATKRTTNIEGAGRKAPPKRAPLDAEFLTFFATAGVAGFFLTGFVYANEYYHSFGLSLLEVDLGYVETVVIGAYPLRDPLMFLGYL